VSVSESVSGRTPGRVPQVWGNVPQRNKNFTGREDILAHLRSGLASSVTVVLPHALQGMGGVGKTQVAVEYAYRYSSDYDLVWWIPADQPPLVRASLAALAAQLGLPSVTASGIESAAAAVLDALRRGHPFARWLLIFDNADQPEDLIDVLPKGGPGHVLVTSRNHRWQSVVETVQVDVFTPNESIEFLTRRIRSTLDRSAASALAAELGYLPLALEQAAALQSETGMSVDEYLTLLKDHTVSLLEEGKSADYPLSMTAAWKLSVSTLERYQAEAVALLRLCAFLGPEPIPRDLFPRGAHALEAPLRDLLADPIRLARAIRELGRFALIRIDGRTIIIHRLIQALLRDDLTTDEQGRYRSEAHLMLATGAPQEPDDDKLWPRFAELVAHMSSAATQLELSGNATVRQFAVNMIRYLYNSGDLEAADSYAERYITTWGPTTAEGDLQLLRAQRERANVLRSLGRYRDAYDMDEAALRVASRSFGERDPFTLGMTSGLGADMRARGDFESALELDARSLNTHREVLGQEHPQTLRAANNLAVDYGLNSRYREARDLYSETYRLRSEGSAEYPAQEVLPSWSGLARALRLCGSYSAARDVGQDAYEYGIAALGDDHPRTLEAAIDLSIALRRIAISYADAAELAQRVFEQARRRFGEQAPLTLAAIVSLTNIQRTSSEVVQALTLSEEATEQYGSLYGRDHPYYHGCVGNVALLYRVNGQLDRARELNEQAMAGLDAKLGRDHHYTLTVAVNLASDLARLGDDAGARALSEDSLGRLRALLGDDHPLALGCAANLVSDLRAVGAYAEADQLFRETLARYRETLGDNHPDTLVAAEGRRLDFDFDSPQI
jgi:tetratricopeptide (TPR) repeat protein